MTVGFAIFFVVACNYGQTPQNPSLRTSNKYDLVENWIHNGGESGIRSRYLFAYIQETDFDLETVTAIVDELQRTYCDPYVLVINIYSDRAMLEKKIKWEKAPTFIDFDLDTSAGRKAANREYEALYRSSKPYFRAEYSRNANYELLDYTPAKEETDTIRVVLREPDKNSGKSTLPANACKASQQK
jgi:hypothetical protein